MNSGVKTKGSVVSPKTPGGISKSLLTPCRRVGLSRNRGKKGTSPFISPLSGENNSRADVKEENVPKKRKICTSVDETSSKNVNELTSTPESYDTHSLSIINNTPTRNIPLSKKKSKMLIMNEKKEQKETVHNSVIIKNSTLDNVIDETRAMQASLSRSNPKKLLKEVSQPNSKCQKENLENNEKHTPIQSFDKNVREISPNNLTKECIFVIQKKMIKNLGSHNKLDAHTHIEQPKCASQTLFESDDETPLCELGKNENDHKDKKDSTVLEVNKLKDKNTSTTGLKNVKTKNLHITKKKPELETSQNSFDDDDDFECSKRTILIKKCYDKVVKPNRAKSTGSITQKDIDELKARIEMKKKQLIVKAMSEDTAELRSLIKKWQKGCQEALFELFDLMRRKFPDKQNMDYSEILQTLKIPPDLVGYDVENDCFVTPDDASVILSSINT